MAGKRQHFIPRFLQLGFVSHTTATGCFTWVYRKGKPPFNTNIINVGVEGQFFSSGTDTVADDNITTVESKFSALIEKLRNCAPDLRPLDTGPLAQLIAHLEARTRHIRQGFQNAAGYLVNRMVDFLGNEELFATYMEHKLATDSSYLMRSFAEELAKRGVPAQLVPEMTSVMVKAIEPHLPAYIRAMRPSFVKLAAQLRVAAPTLLTNAAKSGHMKVFKQTVAPEEKVRWYSDLSYRIAYYPEHPLVLGDAPVLFRVDGSRAYKTFCLKDDRLLSLYLPLSPSRCLIGSTNQTLEPPPNLAETQIRCSLEYFISHTNSTVNDQLASQIGADAALISNAEIEEILTETFQQLPTSQ